MPPSLLVYYLPTLGIPHPSHHGWCADICPTYPSVGQRRGSGLYPEINNEERRECRLPALKGVRVVTARLRIVAPLSPLINV